MHKISLGLVAVALTLGTLTNAQSPIYGQCGGSGWTGPTTCASGSTCVKQNDFYSQCVPSTNAPTTTTSKPATSTSTTTTRPTTTTTTAPPASTGFVRVSGQRFTLNGSPFTAVGTNSYWVGLQGLSTADMNLAFKDIANAKLTVVRTWGFNEVTSPNGNYYQSWSGSTPTVNTGATGLQNFDNVVAAAKANGLRLIVALTNNWSDYGGMDVYVKQILNSPNHDLFYTDATVKAAFKKYISTFVGRYKNEPTIMAWELANEPRCRGSTGTSTGTCTTATVTAWAKELSAYIKSIDSNHLVALGDEGFFNQPGNADYPYQGGEGVDFTANLNIATLDFGTFHAYPLSWGESADPAGWGVKWINDHAAAQKAANKPVLLEEFGVTANQAATYQQWWSAVVSSGLTGDLIWQAASHMSTGDSFNDGYGTFPDGPVYPLFAPHVAAVKARG